MKMSNCRFHKRQRCQSSLIWRIEKIPFCMYMYPHKKALQSHKFNPAAHFIHLFTLQLVLYISANQYTFFEAKNSSSMIGTHTNTHTHMHTRTHNGSKARLHVNGVLNVISDLLEVLRKAQEPRHNVYSPTLNKQHVPIVEHNNRSHACTQVHRPEDDIKTMLA